MCDLGKGYSLAWCVLAYGCSYIFTGFVLQGPSVPFKSNSYLLNMLWITTCSSSDKCLLSNMTLSSSKFLLWESKMWHVQYVVSSKCFIYPSSSLKNILIIEFCNVFHWVSTSFIWDPISPNNIAIEAQYIFNSKNMPRNSTMSYLWWPCDSPMWKFHITPFSHLTQVVHFLFYFYSEYWSHLLVWSNWPAWSFYFAVFAYFLPSTIGELAPESNIITSKLKLALPSLPLVLFHINGV